VTASTDLVTEQTLASRLAPYAGGRSAAEIALLLQRAAATPSARWRSEWMSLIFADLPPDLAGEVLTTVSKAAPTGATNPEAAIEALRGRFVQIGIDAFLVPEADEHQGSWLPAHSRRLAWLTGFTGSAGIAVVTRDAAWLFVDGRYVLQAENEVRRAAIEPRHFNRPPVWTFLAQQLPRGTRLGYDPRLHGLNEIATITRTLEPAGIVLVPVQPNPIDQIWIDRPAKPFSAIVPHPDQYSGRSDDEKRADVAAALTASGAQAIVFNQLDSIAWLLNVRAGDAAYSPVAQSYAIMFEDGHVELFVERSKLTTAAIDHLGNRTTILDIDGFEGALRELGGRYRTVAIDPDRATSSMEQLLSSGGASVVRLGDPTLPLRMRKNEAERDGLRDALARDGAALTKFMHWLSELPLDRLPDEMEIAERVTAFRAEDPLFRGPSFPPIVGVGPNGAIIHYRPERKTNRRLSPGTLLLIDSGGQYLTGTTDITRTFCVGPVPDFEREIFTAVLKSHIALARARFPQGATGAQLDGIARGPLWNAGIEFDHGTGHGIGSYLSVHEGPIRIAAGGDKPLHTDLVISNEPGAYFAGRFGVRIENTLLVVEAGPGSGSDMFLAFETVSVAPIERALISVALLTSEERRWVDAYHAEVRDRLAPRLSGPAAVYLERATEPL
jgi:Xaa-Pro aminopeptidase